MVQIMDFLNIEESTNNDEKEEEDDCGSYFLQPASSPYNITEKVKQANVDLFNDTLNADKIAKVKFKDELVTFEPELTDDDVNSIESDNFLEDIEEGPENNQQILEFKTTINENFNIFDTHEDEEIIEDIESDYDFSVINVEHNYKTEIKDKIDNNDLKNLSNLVPDLKNDGINSIHTTSPDNNNLKVTKKRKNSANKHNSKAFNEVQCKNHCIDKLDCDLSMSIKKLEIREKPLHFPPLKLHQRKCCDETKSKTKQNLPSYNGIRSEYGLSSRQLEMREKRKEIIRLKEQKRQQLLQEYRNRRIQQNEEVFCQWLNDVARRKADKRKNAKSKDINGKQLFSPNVVSFPNNKSCVKMRERPRTANDFLPRHNIKRSRPHTTQSCVYIELPYHLLQRGISIGDLMITNSFHSSKKLHILNVS